VECGSVPKTKKDLEDEPKSVGLRLERAAAIFHAADKLNPIQKIRESSVRLALKQWG